MPRNEVDRNESGFVGTKVLFDLRGRQLSLRRDVRFRSHDERVLRGTSRRPRFSLVPLDRSVIDSSRCPKLLRKIAKKVPHGLQAQIAIFLRGQRELAAEHAHLLFSPHRKLLRATGPRTAWKLKLELEAFTALRRSSGCQKMLARAVQTRALEGGQGAECASRESQGEH